MCPSNRQTYGVVRNIALMDLSVRHSLYFGYSFVETLEPISLKKAHIFCVNMRFRTASSETHPWNSFEVAE